MKTDVIIDGPINLSGVGNTTRGFIRCISEMQEYRLRVYDNNISHMLSHKGISEEELDMIEDLKKVDVSTNAIYIQIGSPRSFKKVPFKYNIGYTLFESDGLHPLLVNQCNSMVDEIWTASRFNKQTFSTSGVNKKIRIIPPMINTDIYNPDIPRLNISNLRGYVFQSNFDFSWRKGMDILLHAYWDEFSDKDDVSLLIKMFSGDSTDNHQINLMNQINYMKERMSLKNKKTAPVLFIGDFIDQKYMANFSNTCDCYVSPFRGEGFGLPIAEAMSLEKDIICTRWSAPVEYVNKDNGFMIDLDAKAPLEPIRDPYQLKTEPLYEGQNMARPSIDSLKELLHRSIEDKDNVIRRSNARNTIIEKFSKEVIKDKIRVAITDIIENKDRDITDGKGLFK